MTVRSLRKTLWLFAAFCLLGSLVEATKAAAGDAIYFSFQPVSALPAAPSSLLVQSPSLINIPAGAVLSVRLMRGDAVVATSALSFSQACANTSLLPPVPVASFAPAGQPAGQPLPGATLTPGAADLAAVAAAPNQYRLLWELSAGVMGTPGRAIVTGDSSAFVDLKLSGVSAAALIGDQKPGSVLFYNRYTSSPANTSRENTVINLTNANPAESVNLRFFFVNGASCEVIEMPLCLAPRQSVSLLAGDLDPGTKGYCVVVACDAAGQPIQFNWLVGNAVVKQAGSNGGSPYSATLSAVAIAKRAGGAATGGGGTAEMVFDDVMYDRLPGQLMIDNIPSQTGGLNSSTLAVYRPLANLAGGTANATLQVTAWGEGADGQATTSSGNVALACYSDVNLATLRLSPVPIGQLIPAGRTAWFALSTADLQPLLGAQFNSGPFSSGSSARPLVFSAEYRIRVPVAAMACTAVPASDPQSQ